MGTLAILITKKRNPEFIHAITDDREIAVLEAAFQDGEKDPLEKVLLFRSLQAKEDDEFGEYVEELLSQPFVRPEVQAHGVQWLRSKIRIEEHMKTEQEAAKIIAEYACKVFKEDGNRTDFTLIGPHTEVRVRIFVLEDAKVRVA